MASSTSLQELVVLTSAGGAQAANLIPLLYPLYRLRLVVISNSSAARLREQWPNADVRQSDINEAAECRRLVQDAAVIYHIGPSLHTHETAVGQNMIDACEGERRRPGNVFKHFVYSSVLNTQFRKMRNHDSKRYVEEYLFESSLNYTVLKPSDFLDWAVPLQFILSKQPHTWGGLSPDGKSLTWITPWNQDTPSSLTALRDLAEVSAKVIAERERHYLAEYPLCSTVPLSRRQIAKDMEDILGLTVKIQEPQSHQEAVDRLLGVMFGEKVPERVRDGMERLILFYQRRGLRGNANVMSWLLGREPTSHTDFIRSEAKRLGFR